MTISEMRIAEAEFHLASNFDADREAVMDRAKQAGVGAIINVGSSIEGSRRAVELAKRYEMVYATVGIHPHDAKTVTGAALAEMRTLAREKKVVAIGETGLDFHYNFSKQPDQRRVFAAHLEISRELDLPVVVHSRNAFDETVEIHFHLNLDVKASDQNVRGTIVLPHGTGKTLKVAVVCQGDNVSKARDAGADFVGGTDLIAKIEQGFLGFDCLIATPDMMKDLSKLGKVLGPRGLMPSPKTGTVTNDIAKAIADIKKGKVEFRVDKQAGIHLSFGKMSFAEDKLYENATRIIEALNDAKPASIKGKFIRSAAISASMTPGLRLAL